MHSMAPLRALKMARRMVFSTKRSADGSELRVRCQAAAHYNTRKQREKNMKTKQEIVTNWLPRYTGVPVEEFGPHVLLTNFGGYLDMFCTLTGATVQGADRPMPSATHDGITMINFGMGSANAATVMDLLTAYEPKAVLFLGKCGGLKRKNQLGDLIQIGRAHV